MNLRERSVTAGWGLFCACSWTWCIGMFLPIVLLREFGWPGFFVFAVPNVIGCAAFGYVLRNAGRRTELLRRHEPAAVLFSATTIAYHMFFMAYLATMVARNTPQATLIAMALPAGVYLAGYGFSWLPQRAWPVAAAVLYAASMATFAVVGTATLRIVPWSGAMTATDLACLAPAFIFGFLLCPYLDLTFHRALGASPSRHAFAIFGLAFIPILLLTAAYWEGYRPVMPIVIMYIAAQATFTVAAHCREIRDRAWPRTRGARMGILLVPACAVAIVLLPIDGEDTYLRFLGFYGLLFPAYVLVFMAGRRVERPARRSLIAWGAAMAALLPVYEAAFIHRLTWPAWIPVAALLAWAAWRAVRLRGRD